MLPLIVVPGILEDATGWAEALTPIEPKVIANRGATVEAMAAALLERAPDRFILLGHSLGGYVALAAALAAPGRVAGLVLVSTTPLPDTPESTGGREALIAAAAIDFPAVARRLARAVLAPANRERCLTRTEAVLLRGDADRFTREQRAAASRPDQTERLAELTMPALVLWGEQDPIVNPAGAEAFSSGLRHCEFHAVADCGHMPQIECPRELGEAVRGWLGRLEQAESRG